MSQQNWSARAQEIQSFKVMDLLKRAHQLDALGADVVHMEAGEPDFKTAPKIAEAAKAAIDADLTHYTAAGGIAPLRERIAQFYQERYGVAISPQQVLVTAGASGALLLAFSLYAEQGKRFMMADPGYPCNAQFLRLIEARAQRIAVGAQSQFQLDAAMVNDHWQQDTAGVLLASPANPTGSVVHKPELAAIANTVAQKGGTLIVDELYHGLTYGFDADTVLSVSSDAVVLNSFSKYFGMTGWRLGWLVAPEDACAEMEKMAQNLFISPQTVSQYAALAAFEPDSIALFEARREEFKQRRDRLIEGLEALGFAVPVVPEGAFYVYADASRFTDNSFDWCWQLLEEEKVAVTPGADFGENQPQRYVRFSFTTGLPQIEKMLERLARFVAR